MHEITHILGFTSTLYEYFLDPANNRPYDKNLSAIYTNSTTSGFWFKGAKVAEKAKKYFGCDTITAMKLEN